MRERALHCDKKLEIVRTAKCIRVKSTREDRQKRLKKNREEWKWAAVEDVEIERRQRRNKKDKKKQVLERISV